MAEMKEAMKSKNEAALRGLRAIKAEIIKAKTEPGAGGQLAEDKEIPMLQKMMKQRRDSYDIYKGSGREDLATREQEEMDIIAKFLPQPLSAEELRAELQAIIAETGASGPGDMGKVMGIATKKLGGKADGKTISATVKELLAS